MVLLAFPLKRIIFAEICVRLVEYNYISVNTVGYTYHKCYLKGSFDRAFLGLTRILKKLHDTR